MVLVGFLGGVILLYLLGYVCIVLDKYLFPKNNHNFSAQNSTLAKNDDDSFINGIMWADVGNDL
tara:strand:+ start:1017 stop:1208 length:192 start_codon:yes stop_codon:yes gene_type:complete